MLYSVENRVFVSYTEHTLFLPRTCTTTERPSLIATRNLICILFLAQGLAEKQS